MPLASASPTQTPVTIWGQFQRHLPRYGLGLILLGVYQYSQYWFDTRLMSAIDDVVNGRHELAIQLGLLLMGVALAAFGVRVASRVVMFNAGRIAEYELRRELLDRLHRLGPSFYRRMSTGEIMSRATNDLTQFRMLLGFAVLNVINTVFALVSSLTVTLTISWKLTLASMAVLPILAVVTLYFSSQMYARTRDNQSAIGKMSERVQSSIAGVRVVRAFGLEERELHDFERTNRNYLETSLSLARWRGSMGPVMQAIVAFGILIVFWYGGHLMLVGELTAGGFLAFYRALARLTWPLIALGFLVSLVQRGRAAYSRLVEIYDAKPDITDGELKPPNRIIGRLEVRNLSFAHGEREILHGVSFTLEPGSSLAIVGRTGSGKSTLAVLLPRLQPTPRGSVFLDGLDICDLPLDMLRQSIGYAQQSAFLFSTTVGRNIGYSLDNPDAADSLLEIRDAAKQARIFDEVSSLPDGFDTVVGERGVQLSGGQKQRVALARAFVTEPKILVLDDPLSAVDARTEKDILKSIEQRTRSGLILITNRVAAAARCDWIVVMDDGYVVEQGTHSELLSKGGLYARFAEEQRIERELERLATETVAAPEAAGA